jgi:transcriptional regulator NrdR family protein
MDTQCGESLSSALRKADVRQRRLLRCVQDVVDGIRDIVKSEVIDAEIPELL